MDKRMLTTTRAVLVVPRSASPVRQREETLDEPEESERRPSVKLTAAAMSTVLTSVNKMQMFRQRTQAAKGNITKTTPLRRFTPLEVQHELEQILESTLKGVMYDPKHASVLTMTLSDAVKSKVKSMKFPRYRLVSLVTICSQSRQSMMMGSQCVWNSGTDTYATAVYGNASLLAVATVFAVFKD
ncbi:TC1D1-like protein [Mya arenaria]|uniref:TC1D1-like protein n=1 Tax=Mya arenaria TaxID=6604 RepID=A0ABY7E3X5_MYAAR|nr:dynein light chain Tctex-type 5-like [Mya arenaria]WAR03094.1 TC1D1-like protein [Mya arenaria]